MTDKLDELYNTYNFPGINKLYKIAVNEGLKVSLNDVSNFIKNQRVSQVFSKTVKPSGHIVAYNPNELIQMDRRFHLDA